MQREVGDFTQQRGSYAHINFNNGHSEHILVSIGMGECSRRVKDGGRQLRYSTSKVKQSHYRPWRALRVPGVWGSQILRQFVHEGGKIVSPTHRPPLPQEIFLVLISVTGRVDLRAIVRPEGICQWKIPMTPSQIDPASFRVVAQCLKHCATAPPGIPHQVTVNISIYTYISCTYIYICVCLCVPFYYSWCHQCYQNTIFSIFRLSSGTEKNQWG
jgi:hypothetical protein